MGKKSNRYAHSPHRAVLPLQGAVLPLGREYPFETQQRGGKKARRTVGAVVPLVLTVLPQMVAVLLLASGTKKINPCLPPLDLIRDFGPERYYRLGAAVVPLWSGTTAQEPR